MKKLLLVVMGLMFMVGFAYADELNIGEQIEKIPALKQGLAYSMVGDDLCYLSTIELLNWKGIALEGGFSSKDKIVAVASYELLKLKDLGVSVPVLDLITARVGIYAGISRFNASDDYNADDGNNDFDWGLSLTLLDIKF